MTNAKNIIQTMLEDGYTLSQVKDFLEDGAALAADGITDQDMVEEVHTIVVEMIAKSEISTIKAITFDANNNSNENVQYTSNRVTARTLLKALRSIGTERMRFLPVIEINGQRFYKYEIHEACQGCRTVADAEWFLKHKAA